MARTARPWFRDDRNAWYVTLDGRRHRLGEHPDGYPKPRLQRGKWNVPKPILDRFHELLRPTAPRPAESPPVADVFEQFLTWCQVNRSPRTAGRTPFRLGSGV